MIIIILSKISMKIEVDISAEFKVDSVTIDLNYPGLKKESTKLVRLCIRPEIINRAILFI